MTGKMWRAILLAGVLGLLLVGGATFLYITSYLDNPCNYSESPFRITISKGMTINEVARLLQSKGVIRNAREFAVFCELSGKSIPAGEYVIPPRLRPGELANAFCPRHLALRRVTIPEGSTLRDVAAILRQRLGIPESETLALCHDASFASQLGVKASSLEGYLFPETYYFGPGASVRKVVATMVREFFQVVMPILNKSGHNRQMTLHQIVTIASLIEKETAVGRERPLIAAVIYNRLRRNMPLQLDPSVIYGLKDFDGNLTRKDLKTDTEYNTYTRRGLPPGPICSPSRESIWAAVNPADADFLYFVSMNNGYHIFSRTAAEHARAVRRYQKRLTRRRGRR